MFYSEDAGAHWKLPQQGPANVSVDELFFLDDEVIVAATHGRGLFKSNTTTSPTAESQSQVSLEPPSPGGESGRLSLSSGETQRER